MTKTYDKPQLDLLHDEGLRAMITAPFDDEVLPVEIDGVVYQVRYDSLACLTDEDKSFMRLVRSRDPRAVAKVRETKRKLPFLAESNSDWKERGYTFDWCGNVWTKNGHLLSWNNNNGYLRSYNKYMHKVVVAEFLVREPKQLYRNEIYFFDNWTRWQVHHMEGQPLKQISNALTNLKLLNINDHAKYTMLMGHVRDEVREKLKELVGKTYLVKPRFYQTIEG